MQADSAPPPLVFLSSLPNTDTQLVFTAFAPHARAHTHCIVTLQFIPQTTEVNKITMSMSNMSNYHIALYESILNFF